VGALKSWGDFAAVVSNLLLAAGITLSVGAWLQRVPWWVPVGVFSLLFLYGLLAASYDEFRAVKRTNERLESKIATAAKRKAIKDQLGEAIKEGRRLRTYGKGEQAALRPAVSKWVDDTQGFIERAFEKAEALYFRGSEIDDRLWPVDECLRRLDHLRAQANDLNINPDFDPQNQRNH